MEELVRRELGDETVEEILANAPKHRMHLWAQTPPPDFADKTLLLALAKDLKGYSYEKLRLKASCRYDVPKKTLVHNVKQARLVLNRWSRRVLQPSQPDDLLLRAPHGRGHPPRFAKVGLWVDTSDFQKQGYAGISKKGRDWSHKLNRAGRRWMVITDANGTAQYISGPHSPKEYDGDILIGASIDVKAHFPGVDMIGDNHFRKAQPFLQPANLFTPVSAAGRPRMVNGVRVKRTLTPEQETANAEVHAHRARVEWPYGLVKGKWRALGTLFREDEVQHDCLVRTAFACQKMKRGAE